jgi:hypothetical protein
VYLGISHAWLTKLAMVDVSLLAVLNRWPYSASQDVKIILKSWQQVSYLLVLSGIQKRFRFAAVLSNI